MLEQHPDRRLETGHRHGVQGEQQSAQPHRLVQDPHQVQRQQHLKHHHAEHEQHVHSGEQQERPVGQRGPVTAPAAVHNLALTGGSAAQRPP